VDFESSTSSPPTSPSGEDVIAMRMRIKNPHIISTILLNAMSTWRHICGQENHEDSGADKYIVIMWMDDVY
jgi:hypothetical protein